MAQVKLLKIGSLGLPQEFDSAADDVTLASFTANGGAVLSGTGLDMNGTPVGDTTDLSWTDPTTDGITVTAGTFPADEIMIVSKENTMTTAGAVTFPVITDTAGEVDAFRLPALAGTPTATPTTGGEGHLVWDSTSDRLFVWDGATWKDQSIVEDAERLVNIYTAGAGGIADRDLCYISGADTVLKAAATADATALSYIGFARGAAAATDPVSIVSEGLLDGFTGLTAGARYYMSATAGLITATAPSGSGNHVIQAGVAKNTTDLHIRFQYIGKKAA